MTLKMTESFRPEADTLVLGLGCNPVHCLGCNGEVLPDKLACGERLAEAIASWNSVYGSLYLLWLDSGEYEEWARDRLLDPKGQANSRGLDLVRQLDQVAKTYYLWFYESAETSPSVCPLCGGEFIKKAPCRYLICEPCRLIV